MPASCVALLRSTDCCLAASYPGRASTASRCKAYSNRSGREARHDVHRKQPRQMTAQCQRQPSACGGLLPPGGVACFTWRRPFHASAGSGGTGARVLDTLGHVGEARGAPDLIRSHPRLGGREPCALEGRGSRLWRGGFAVSAWRRPAQVRLCPGTRPSLRHTWLRQDRPCPVRVLSVCRLPPAA